MLGGDIPCHLYLWWLSSLNVADVGDSSFEAALTCPGGWDGPRSGIALVGGQRYYFDCQFSEELDHYTGQFRLWPVPGGELADGLEAWQMSTAWRDEYDSGLQPGHFPGGRQSAALERCDAAVSASRRRMRGWRSLSGALITATRSQAVSSRTWLAGLWSANALAAPVRDVSAGQLLGVLLPLCRRRP